MNLRDVLSGIFWLAIAVFVCLESVRVGLGTVHNPGSGFLPFWSAVVMGTLSVVLVATKGVKRGEKRGLRELWRGVRWEKAVFVLISLFAYAALLDALGYIVTTFGMLTFLFGIVGGSRLWMRLLIAAFTAVITYVVFDVWLGVQLPKGILGY